jgi:hypothetical protein
MGAICFAFKLAGGKLLLYYFFDIANSYRSFEMSGKSGKFVFVDAVDKMAEQRLKATDKRDDILDLCEFHIGDEVIMGELLGLVELLVSDCREWGRQEEAINIARYGMGA